VVVIENSIDNDNDNDNDNDKEHVFSALFVPAQPG